MARLFKEIKDDASFIKSHTLQPRWYKILKPFLILGFLVGYYLLFGIYKTVFFFTCFFLLSFLVHMIYRVKTEKYQKSWLDFLVVEVNGEVQAKSIGKYYYGAIVINTLISFLVSQSLG
jgi:hypothetical protein